MTPTLLPASVLPGLLEVALTSRLNAQALFDAAGIAPEDIGRADRFVDLERVDPLLQEAFRPREDPWFGLEAGRRLGYGQLDGLGSLMATADTLGAALETFLRYKNLLVPWLEFTLAVGNERARLDFMAHPRLGFAHSRAHAELVLAGMVAIGRSLVGDGFGLRCVGFVHGEPADTAPYRETFAVPIEFDCESNRIEIARAALAIPLPGAFPRRHRRLRRRAEQRLSRISPAQGIAGKVLALLEARIGSGDTSIEAVAAVLELTPRTLQRRLSQEELTFAGLRDQIRHRRACAMLAADELDMARIATSLGFSDTANFYHAFKRWEGCAPGEYRRQHRRS